MKSTVIRVLRNADGLCISCVVEHDFRNKSEAMNYANELNRIYGTKQLNWFVDTYKA